MHGNHTVQGHMWHRWMYNTSYRCYRAHIVNKHSERISDERVNTEETFLDHETHSIEEMDSVCFDDPVTEISAERPKLYNKALFLLKLKEERRLSQLAVNGLIGDISTLLEEEISSLKKDVIKCMHEEHASTELISKIHKQFSDKITAPPFEGLQTAYLQKKYFTENFHLVVSKHNVH